MHSRRLLRVQRHKRFVQQSAARIAQRIVILAAGRRIAACNAFDLGCRLRALLLQPQQQDQHDHLQPHFSACQKRPCSCKQRLHVLIGNGAAGHMTHSVDQHEADRLVRLQKRLHQRLQKLSRLRRLAAGKHRLADRFERIGDAHGVLGRDFPVRVETQIDILPPQLHSVVEQRAHRRRILLRPGRCGPLLSVLGAAVGQNLTHDLSGLAAHIAVGMHKQFVQQYQRLALIGTRHVGIVFLQQQKIRPDALQIFFALGPLQQLLERLVGAHRVHQPDTAVKRHTAKCLQRLFRRHERRIGRIGALQLAA